MIDPSKDKFAYFKDNIQTAEDKEFDASQYYYHREDLAGAKGGSGSGAGGLPNGVGAVSALNLAAYGMAGGALGGGLGDAMAQQSVFSSGFPGSGMLGGGAATSFLGAPMPRAPLGGGIGVVGGNGLPVPGLHDLHRLGSGDHLSMSKGRTFPLQPETKAPDMSEFPALSRTNSWALDQPSDSSSSSSRSQNSAEFVIQKEDFPALSPFGSAPNSNDKMSMMAGGSGSSPMPLDGSGGGHAELKRHASFHSSASDSMAPPPRPPSGLAGSHAGGATASATIGSRGGYNLHDHSHNSQSQNNSSISGTGAFGGSLHAARHGLSHHHHHATTTSGNGNVLDPTNQFGLLGMLHSVIRPSNDATKNLLMGCDLTSLGLNLNSAEPLYPIFASPWADGPLTKEQPQFTLPMCYYNTPPALKTTHLVKFHLETLFYIFYSMPKDVLQAYAAQELYSRDWRYHGELKMWLKRATPADAALFATTAAASSSSSPGSAVGAGSPSTPSAGAGSGSGSGSMGSIGSIGSGSSASSSSSLGAAAAGPQFLFFDTTTWERRVFTGNIHALSAGLVSEDEIRVKFNAAT